MTKEALENYENLRGLFQIRCETICDMLRPLDNAFKYVYEFKIINDLVECEGVERWYFGGEQNHYAEFPKDYICMDDKEIQKIVNDELKKRADEESRKKAIDEKLKTEKEKAEYERLKKIYG